MSILVMSHHNSFRVPFDEIASVYFILKIYIYILLLATDMARPRNQHCANCIGTLSFSLLRWLSR